MAEQRLAQAAEKTMVIVRSIAGHPDVSAEEAGELLLLTGQRLEAARALSGLQQFPPAEIELAKQFINSLEPAARSRVEGFETVQKILDQYQQLATFDSTNEAILKIRLSKMGISYEEPNTIRVWYAIKALGYTPGSNGSVLNSPNTVIDDFWNHQISILKPRPNILAKGFFGRTVEKRQDSIWLGLIDWYNNPWRLLVYGRDNVHECGIVAKLLGDHLKESIKVELSTEKTRYGEKL